MQIKTNFFTLSSKFIFILGFVLLLTRPSLSENFTCAKIFRSEYSMFLFKSPSFLNNEVPMMMTANGHTMKGVLKFNMCFDTTIENYKGDGTSLTAKFIFLNEEQKPGEPQYILFNEKEEDTWNYSIFKADSEAVNLGGVRVDNPALKMTMVGGQPNLVNMAANQLENKVIEGLQNFNPLSMSIDSDQLNVKKEISKSNSQKHFRL